MSFIQEKRVTTGELMGGAFRHLAGVRKELLIYFIVFSAVTFLPLYDFSFGWVFMILGGILYFVAQYLLYRAMLRNAGLAHDGGFRVLQFIVMAVVLSIPISIGFNLFWIPGLLLMAKWIMAPAFLVAQTHNPFKAMGQSWNASEFNTLHLTLASGLMCIIWFISFVALMLIWDLAGTTSDEISGFFLWMHILPVLLGGLSVSAYQLLSDDTSSLTEVFA